jgi:hypothetical protein
MCTASHLATIAPTRSVVRATTAFIAALILSPLALMVATGSMFYPSATALPLDVWLPRVATAALTAAIPAAMLSCVLLLRREATTTHWHAVASRRSRQRPLRIWQLGFDAARLHAADGRAAGTDRPTQTRGRSGWAFEYPWSAVRQVRGATSQRSLRLAAIESFVGAERNLRAQRVSGALLTTRAAQPLVLLILFGNIGWLLGSRDRATMTRAIGWWLLVWLALFFLGRPLGVLLPHGAPRGIAFWSPTILFFGALLALRIESSRLGTPRTLRTSGTLGTSGTFGTPRH